MSMSAGNALLWSIEADPASPASYLFGTMHSASPASLQFLPRVEPFILGCSSYYGETDIGQLLETCQPPPPPGREGRKNPSLPAPPLEWKGLKSLLAPPAYAKARHFLEKWHGLDLDALQDLPPLFIPALIHEKYLSRSGGDPLDLRLWHLAKRAGLETGGVESMERQLEIYRKIPFRIQLLQLKAQLKSLSSSFRQLKRLEEAYANEDLSRLYKLSRRQLNGMKRLMIDQRNREMTAFIKNTLDRGPRPAFFALGAAHLPGSKGILRMLKTAGFALRPFSLMK
jgi:uncharacterized protein YbaP (TraB family)